jgi:hypothetical protein
MSPDSVGSLGCRDARTGQGGMENEKGTDVASHGDPKPAGLGVWVFGQATLRSGLFPFS